MRALVTGGAGFVGSHMVKTLLAAGHTAIVLDDLSTGHRDAVPNDVAFVHGGLHQTKEITALLRQESIDAVFHFAAKIRVEESVSDPRAYYRTNVVGTLSLLDAVLESDRKLAFVQSSTAAVYGTPNEVPIPEDHACNPVSPYGEAKLAVERALDAYGKAYGLRWAALRYFNAAGADHEAGLGERHDPETHLIPIVLEVAEGKRAHVAINGASWPTPDGTCVRDYIHVSDLCEAHMLAVLHLHNGGDGGAFNLGTGRGHSVREIVHAAREITGHSIPTIDGPPRAGDPATLIAKVERAERVLGWRATRTELHRIVGDAWAFRQELGTRR